MCTLVVVGTASSHMTTVAAQALGMYALGSAFGAPSSHGRMKPVVTAPPGIIERSFSLHYGLGSARQTAERGATPQPALPGEDVAIARHKNGICVVCLSPSHPVRQQGLNVLSVAFKKGLVRPVQGKRKRGGAFLDPESVLASVICETGETFVVRACVKGVLVEVNPALEKTPGLIATKPLTNGYLAVVLPSHNDRERATARLLDHDPADKAAH